MKKGFTLLIILFSIFLISLISAEKIGIEYENKFLQKGDLEFVITIYDDNLNPLRGTTNYIIKNFYSEIMAQGEAESGKKIIFAFPENAYKGPWEITANFKDVGAREVFNVGELKKVDVKLKEDFLIIKNVGNVFYDEKILIKIGNQDQIAIIPLDIGQVKKIKLTAPQGEYTIIVDVVENEVEDIVFSNVYLTGDVVGLERVFEGNFLEKSIVSLFLSVLSFVAIIVMISKIHHKFSIKKNNGKKKRSS